MTIYSMNLFSDTVLDGIPRTVTFTPDNTVVIKTIIVTCTSGVAFVNYAISDDSNGALIVFQKQVVPPFNDILEPNYVMPVNASITISVTGADMDFLISGFS